MSGLAVFLGAIVAITLALLVDRYFAWRSWDQRRRNIRLAKVRLDTLRMRMRLTNFEIGHTTLPAMTKLAVAVASFGKALRALGTAGFSVRSR